MKHDGLLDDGYSVPVGVTAGLDERAYSTPVRVLVK
jgi:hypothetical protein